MVCGTRLLCSCIISSPFKSIREKLHLGKGLHGLHDCLCKITVLLLAAAEVSTAVITKSRRLDFPPVLLN